MPAFGRVGLLPEVGTSWALTRRLGYQVAFASYLAGEHLDAHRARELGLVQEVVAPEELLAAAGAWCDRIAALAPHARAPRVRSPMYIRPNSVTIRRPGEVSMLSMLRSPTRAGRREFGEMYRCSAGRRGVDPDPPAGPRGTDPDPRPPARLPDEREQAPRTEWLRPTAEPAHPHAEQLIARGHEGNLGEIELTKPTL